ncbi:MAG: hypothetical protein O4805_00650 [Trichodesmium sp. St16_bin2-tuft]|nr:hypothetical protein [Trichodesmium sp. St16_bin2-tuft]MDE5106530.1 hypothetical protein [Trichodesmium sp. St17_bin3_1_1]MDE5123766.1 hypothetical protein [Trichodesmium sp. St19_bin1]
MFAQKNKIWVWTVINSQKSGIMKFVIGDRSAVTFPILWQMIQGWTCFLELTGQSKFFLCKI